MRRIGTGLGFVVIVASIVVVTSAGAAPEGKVGVKEINRVTVAGPMAIRTTEPTDVATSLVTLDAGATIGWHRHAGPVVVGVKSGTLTRYLADDPKCAPTRFSPGQGFFVPQGTVFALRNEGTTRVELISTALAPPGAELDGPASGPADCPPASAAPSSTRSESR